MWFKLDVITCSKSFPTTGHMAILLGNEKVMAVLWRIAESIPRLAADIAPRGQRDVFPNRLYARVLLRDVYSRVFVRGFLYYKRTPLVVINWHKHKFKIFDHINPCVLLFIFFVAFLILIISLTCFTLIKHYNTHFLTKLIRVGS